MSKIIKLIPPKLSDYCIKEKITCIRAHRERIFQISTQELNNKLIFHNYGQGGSGWTFLFGSVNKSIKLFEQEIVTKKITPQEIMVIGAGCYGLLTGIILNKKGYNVKIIAKDTENITSFKAAGFFFPRPRKNATQDERDTFLHLGLESYRNYKQIFEGTHEFIKLGVKLVPAYYGFDINPGFEPYINAELISNPETVTIDFGAKKYFANLYNIMFINPSIMMQELKRLINELRIEIIKKEICDFSEINENIIFNCSGWGSKKLTEDKKLVPVQGHLISLKNQDDINELQYMINFKVTVTLPNGTLKDELIYFAPKDEGVLGITFIRGQDSLTANQHEFDRLLDRCKSFFYS